MNQNNLLCQSIFQEKLAAKAAVTLAQIPVEKY
jgi:hypothetical protein